MNKYILIYIIFIGFNLSIQGQEHQWNEPFFVNINLGGNTRFDMEVDDNGNTYLIALFENEVTILDTTLYTSKDDGVFLAKFDDNHTLLWARVIAEAKELTPNISRVLGSVFIELDKSTNYIYLNIGYADSVYFNHQLYTVDQSLTYYQDLAVLKLSPLGNIENTYHIKGSCTSVMEISKFKIVFCISI